MKKILLFGLILCLLVSMVSAQQVGILPGEQKQEFNCDEICQQQIKLAFKNTEQLRESIQNRFVTITMPESKLGQIQIQSKDYDEELEVKAIAEKFQNRNRFELAEMNAFKLENTNTTMLIHSRQVNFLGFQLEFKDKYVLDDEGNIVDQNRPFWSYMFRRRLIE